MRPATVRPGDVVIVLAFDEVPEHLFLIEEVLDDYMTGVALTGPLAGEYGEPDRAMIVKVLGPQGTQQSLQRPEKNQEIRKLEIWGRMPMGANAPKRQRM
jgi:hypothetical protein